MKNYTKIPNELLEQSQLTIQERYLLCVLLKFCGKDDWCFPSQNTLAKVLGFNSPRHIRNILGELGQAGHIYKKRRGFNRSNTYRVSKSFNTERKPTSLSNGKCASSHLRSALPIHQGNEIPTKSTYLKGKGKRSLVGLEKCRKTLEKKGIIASTKIILVPKTYEKIKN